METHRSKLDDGLRQVLENLSNEEEIDVLLFPKQMGDELRKFLIEGKNDSKLDFNILKIANCIAVKAPKAVIMNLATREDVDRITAQPKFTTDRGL